MLITALEKARLDALKQIKKDKNPSRIFRRGGSFFETVGKQEWCIDDELPFDIPDSWEWGRLSNISIKIHYGFTSSAASTGNAKMLRITDIQNNKVDWPTVPFCTVSAKEKAAYALHNRDIMIARTGGTIGKTYIVRNLSVDAVFASYLIRVVPADCINEEYIKYFMESTLYWTQLTSPSMGTGQPNVNGQALSNLCLPLPPLAEQHRIVARLNEILPQLPA